MNDRIRRSDRKTKPAILPVKLLTVVVILTMALFLYLINIEAAIAHIALGAITVCLAAIWFVVIFRLRRYELQRGRLEAELRDEKDLAQMYLETAGVILLAIDAEGKVTMINQRGCEILGYSKDEIVGKNWFDNFIPRDMTDNMKTVFRRLLHKEDGLFGYFENPVITRSGEARLIAWNNRIIRDETGKIAGTLSSGEDITDSKEAEEKSMRLSTMYLTLSNINKTIIHTGNRQKLFDEVCRIAVEIGQLRMAWIGLVDPATRMIKPVARFGAGADALGESRVSSENIPEGRGPTGTAVREGKYSVVNDIAKDSRMLPWQDSLLQHGLRSSAAFPIRQEGHIIGAFNFYAGQPDYFDKEEADLLQGLAAEISFALDAMEQERKRRLAEEEYKKAMADWQITFDASADSIMLLDKDFRILRANRATSELLNKPIADILGKHCFELTHGTKMPPEFCPLSVMLGTKKHEEAEVYFPEKKMWAWVTTSPVMDESGKPALAVHVIRDITSRKKTEEALRQSEHRYEVIAQETGYLVYDHDIAGRSVRWSGAIDEVTGFSKDELNAVGAGGREEMVHPDDRLAVSGSFADARAKGGKYRIAYRLRRKDGSYIRIEDRGMFIQNDQGKPVRMLGLIKKADRAE